MSALRLALAAAHEEFGNAAHFDDWPERRNIFAAIDLLDDAFNERPDDQAAIGPALSVVQQMLRELNERGNR